MKFYPLEDKRRKVPIIWCLMRIATKLGTVRTYCSKDLSELPSRLAQEYPKGMVCIECLRGLSRLSRK